MNDDELLDVLRQALAHAERQVARYRDALAVLTEDEVLDDAPLERIPTPDTPPAPAKLPKRRKPAKPREERPAAKRTGRGKGAGFKRFCQHCSKSVDARYLTRHEAKCDAGPKDFPSDTPAEPAPSTAYGVFQCCTPDCNHVATTAARLSVHTHQAHDRDLLLPETRPIGRSA